MLCPRVARGFDGAEFDILRFTGEANSGIAFFFSHCGGAIGTMSEGEMCVRRSTRSDRTGMSCDARTSRCMVSVVLLAV
jgi:hypothetical protein